MMTIKIKTLSILQFVVVLMFNYSSFAITDSYPKNLKIDVINYIFNIELSDNTDEIHCETTIDLRFLDYGVDKLRLDLINISPKLKNRGMIVSSVKSNDVELKFTHENDELWIYFNKSL